MTQTLRDYKNKNRLKLREIAAEAGLSPQLIGKAIKGEDITAASMRAIAKATGYKVMPNDLVFPNGISKQKDGA